MFRQNLVSCHCQLFSPHNYEFYEFRSPPSHPTQKQIRSKRSLKSQSHSNHRPIQHPIKIQRKTEQTEGQNEKNIRMIPVPVRVPSYLTAESDCQFKIIPTNITKISLAHSKISKTQNTNKPKQIFRDSCPIRSIKYQEVKISTQPNQAFEAMRDITLNSNVLQNTSIKLAQSNAPIFDNTYPKYKQNSTYTTLAGSVVPQTQQNYDKTPYQNLQYFERPPQTHLEVIKKDSFGENFRQLRSNTTSNFFKLSRLSQMINEKEEAESVYEGEKSQQQGGAEYSRVLISCKKLMEEKNGLLQDTQRTKLFDYFPEPSKRTNYSSTFQKINLIPSSIR